MKRIQISPQDKFQTKVAEVKDQLRQLGTPQLEFAGVNMGRITDTGTVGKNKPTPNPKPSNSSKPPAKDSKPVEGTKGAGKSGRLEVEDFTKEILKTKPMNSRVPEKWYKKGGYISIDDIGTWTYTNKSGISVSSLMVILTLVHTCIQRLNQLQLKCIHLRIIQKILKGQIKKLGLLKTDSPIFDNRPSLGYTWHHHQDGKTMVLVQKDIHDEFKHIGGQSKVNGKKNKE
ncbi:HNH endonuclease signature motif containing protein [Lysinibacillus mangiferihumi]|uniref:HNH endonuclease signature motif containing protein n=1 Tax=Lysinibacillus mangiferihumi TaxID=1130819 RepID=UPI001F16F5BA|nr:HNH endonuclease [Lysinibacillus mangiferihumi]